MKKVLVTGGTVFVSRYIAEYYVQRGCDVFVLNRNTREQSEGVTLIEADRRNLGSALKGHSFDMVFDVTAYQAEDVDCLLNGLDTFGDYILISSSAVYPESCAQPFTEETPIGENRIWGAYGMGKVEAERALQRKVPTAYILRPPYLYGPMNNVYRESFAFDCAMQGRRFYLPGGGQMGLQFFHVRDLCRFMNVLIQKHPEQRIFNVGNERPVTVKEWVELCYQAAGKQPDFVNVFDDIEQRNYFSFYHYEYLLDVTKQKALMKGEESLEDGLREAFLWYEKHSGEVRKKPFFDFIDQNLT